MTDALQTSDLSRSYDNFQALMPTDLILHSSEIAVLIGPNGAGKTTLLLCLSGLLRRTSGIITIGGHDLYTEEKEAKRQLAFVPDVPRFYTELTAWEHFGGTLCLTIPAGIMWWLSQYRWIGILLSIAASLLLAYGVWHMAGRKYRSII